jgi:hypothetical protein
MVYVEPLKFDLMYNQRLTKRAMLAAFKAIVTIMDFNVKAVEGKDDSLYMEMNDIRKDIEELAYKLALDKVSKSRARYDANKMLSRWDYLQDLAS